MRSLRISKMRLSHGKIRWSCIERSVLIGEWKGTGQPEGSLRDRQTGFWTEEDAWSWHFKGDDAWMRVAFDHGKYFKSGELRFIPDKDEYRLTLKTVGDTEPAPPGIVLLE